MFHLSNITKSYGGRTLFRNVTWRIDPGDRIGLVGPNGAGKTTLLRILTGDETADEGQFAVPRGTRVGYLAQEVRTTADGTVFKETLAALPEIGELEAGMKRLEKQMASAPPDRAAELAHEHGEMLERFQRLDGYSFDARAQEILHGLGFSDADMEKEIHELSGGWAMRVELARLLLAKPDLLLLDEPTNHLDLESLEWLEAFLQDYGGAWVVVSHDRYFLNRMVNKIVDLGLDTAMVFPGNYDAYIKAREEIDARLAKEHAQREKRMAELRGFIDRFRAKATKARQAQSRAKMLEKMEKELEEASAVPQPRQRKSLNVKLPPVKRSGNVPIRLDRAKKAYGENVVYESLDFSAERGDKIALVGVNGAGKSTLLKMLAGVIAPDAGARQLGHNTTAYYFAQHQIDVLDVGKTVLRELWDDMPDEVESRVRGILGAFLFSGDDVEKSVGVLSGGEKSRLALAKMLAKPPNLLLLDEPTNHLDLDSREVLEQLLIGYKGTIIFISHDRYFINRIAGKVVEIKVGGEVTVYPGDYDYYQWKRQQLSEAAASAVAVKPRDRKKKSETSKDETSEKKPGPAKSKSSAKAERERRKAEDRKKRRREREAQQLEGRIHEIEARLKEIDQLMCDPDVYADAGRCKELLDERETLNRRLERTYAKWEKLAS